MEASVGMVCPIFDQPAARKIPPSTTRRMMPGRRGAVSFIIPFVAQQRPVP